MRFTLPLVLLFLAASLTRAADSGFRVGAFAQDITPTTWPAPVNGGMKGAFASSVNDPMHARSLALHDGGHELILCVVDSCHIPREVCEQAKRLASVETGVPARCILISATHSHTCAAMTPAFQSDPDPAYVAGLPARIAAGIIAAHRNLEPAEVAWGRDQDPSQVFNRRWFMRPEHTYENPFGSTGDRALMNPGNQNPRVSGPAGPVDPEVWILAARSKRDGRPLAVLGNYSLHYVGGLPAISADYFGAFAAEMGRRLQAGDARYARKPAFVGIMSNGTSGNINNNNVAAPAATRRKEPGEQIAAVARSVADAACRAWDRLEWHSAVPLASVERDLTLAVRKATPEELERARRIVESTARDKDGQFSDRKAIYAREALLLDAYPDRVPVKLQVHRIGGLTIAAAPCEIFVEIGLELKAAQAPRPHFTISLANGYNGYLPTPEHHRLGGYETWRARSSYLEVEASTIITRNLREMLGEVAR
jgi:hypothetical protein